MSAHATYRAPSQHGEALILPSLGQAEALIQENRRRQARWQWTFCGSELAHWQRIARADLIRDALRYTRSYRDVTLPAEIEQVAQGVLVMAGHQPTLFHPGVWFKNFAIDAIQRRLAAGGASGGGAGPAVAVNLVIDNDVATSSSVPVPGWDRHRGRVRRQAVAYDSAAGGVPYEQNWIRDRAVFDGFAEAVQQVIAPLVPDPLVSELWPHVVSAARRCENVSCALAQGRHALEGQQGLQTLEIPLSVVCRSQAFAAFVLALIEDPPHLRSVYNQCAAEYRRAHGIRSSAHPVPSLACEADEFAGNGRDPMGLEHGGLEHGGLEHGGLEQGDSQRSGQSGQWVEVPLWIYSDQSPQRRAAWARVREGRLEISDRQGLSLHLTHPSDSPEAAAELTQRCGPHFKLRPRALLTTMYARLLLSDLFVHGIGGAKYDELGDEIIRRLLGLAPPELMVVSATVLLPVDKAFKPNVPTVAELRQQIRRTYFAPETFAEQVDLPAELCQFKRRLIAEVPPSYRDEPGKKKRWQQRLAAVNGELSRHLAPLRHSLTEQLPAARQAEQSNAILSSREHSFCLFPLQELMQVFARNL